MPAAGSAQRGQQLAQGAPEQSIERVERDIGRETTTADGNVDTSRGGCDHHNQVSGASFRAPAAAAAAAAAASRPASLSTRPGHRAEQQPQTAGARRGAPQPECQSEERERIYKPQPVSLQDGGVSGSSNDENNSNNRNKQQARPLILITEPSESGAHSLGMPSLPPPPPDGSEALAAPTGPHKRGDAAPAADAVEPAREQEDKFEVIDGISYRIVAAVTKRPEQAAEQHRRRHQELAAAAATSGSRQSSEMPGQHNSSFKSLRRKSSAFVANLLHNSSGLFVPSSRSSSALGESHPPNRRMSIYELTKSPPPETSIEMYLNDRRRSSTVSAKFVQQQLEQQSTFESSYSARQQYFKDLNSRLIKQDNKNLLNVVANRGQIHRHSVDIAQLPLFLAQSSAHSAGGGAEPLAAQSTAGGEILEEADEEQENEAEPAPTTSECRTLSGSINQAPGSSIIEQDDRRRHPLQRQDEGADLQLAATTFRAKPRQLASIVEAKASAPTTEAQERQQRDSLGQLSQLSSDKRHRQRRLASQSSQSGGSNLIVRRFQKFDASALSCAPSPDVKIGQRVAYKEYYGNEFGTIRWIGRVPQISPDWTVGVEFDNAIGEGDGSLNGRRYFIAKDCFAKFLPLANVALVDQHVGRPEPGTMISVMSAAVRPGQMISIQRVSTVHVQHCFLNAPHQRPGAEFLAVNTRLHCQCPNCGPCAHVVKPPRTQRLLIPKNATHMCQFSTYTCCGMESSEEALCTYTGNKISSLPPPPDLSGAHYGRWPPPPPLGNSWMDGSGYLSQLQAEQQKLMPEEYRLGAAPEDTLAGTLLRRTSSGRRRARSRQEGVAPCDPNSPIDRPTSAGQANGRASHKHQHSRHRHRHKHRRNQERRAQNGAEAGPGPDRASAVVSPVYANLVGGLSEPIQMQNSDGACGGPADSTQRRPESEELMTLTPMTTPPKAPDNNGSSGALRNGSGAKLNDSPPLSGAGPASLGPFEQPLDSHETTCEQFDYGPPPSARDVNGTDVGTDEGDGDESKRHGPEPPQLSSAPSSELHLGEDGEPELRGPAVVQYRDSIENRYLFPTDDIDSTLEADLETLSQARYGQFGRSTRSSVSNCSSEENLRRRWPAIRLARKRWRRRRQRAKKRRKSGDDPGQKPHNDQASNQRQRQTSRWPDFSRQPGGGASGGGGGGGGKRYRKRHFAPDGQYKMASRVRLDAEGYEHDGDHYEQVLSYGSVSSSTDASYHRHRHSASRNIILKGLRSLVVSCLSASNQAQSPSACMTPPGSSTDKRHHHHHHACGHHHQRHRRAHTSGGHSASGVSATSERCRSAGCRCNRAGLDDAPIPFAEALTKDCGDHGDGLGLIQANSEAILAGQLEQLHLGKTTATAFIDCADTGQAYDGGGAHLEAAGAHYINLDHHARCRHEDKTCSFEPDCGQSLPLIEWRCCQTANWSSQQHQQQAASERATSRRQISSSSDCGFSSASQNSMNMTTNNSNRSSNDSNSHAGEQRRLAAIYRRLTARLTGNDSHGSRPVSVEASDDDLLRLKRVLAELHSEACGVCRAHANCNCHHHKKISPHPPTTAGGDDGPRSCAVEQLDDASRQESEGSRTGVATIEPVGPAGESLLGRCADQSDERQKTLTRPFELKLTLSFSPDPTGQNVTAQGNCGLKLSGADQTGAE